MERRNLPTALNYRPIANSGLPYNADQMRGLQVKQPFTGDGGENTMIFHLPTTGYDNILFSFAAIDQGAADAFLVDYSHEGPDPAWLTDGLQMTSLALTSSYTLFTINFSAPGNTLEAVNNNPDFKVRIRFQGSNMDTDNGDRVTFNNISLDGTPMDGVNLPPVVSNPVSLQKLIENDTPSTFDLNNVFSDPENDPLTFSAGTNMPNFVQTSIEGSNLVLNPVRRGEARITVSADDGHNPPVSHTFRVLVYPQAFNVGNGDFFFGQWDNTNVEYAYPENMIFLQSDISDPGLDYDLLYPYYIPHDDYHADDQGTIGFPYNNTGRTRINGLGVGGVTFINTGRNRDLGGALVAINTTGESSLSLSFTAGTMLQNSRIYAFRLMYRVGVNGPFTPVLSGGQPVEYIAGNDGDLMQFSNINLPSQIMGQPYVQLMWRYYLYSGESGPRSMLRLDDIGIARSTNVEEKTADQIKVFASMGGIRIENPVQTSMVAEVYNLSGQLVYAEPVQGHSSVTLRRTFPTGVWLVRLVSDDMIVNRKVLVW